MPLPKVSIIDHEHASDSISRRQNFLIDMLRAKRGFAQSRDCPAQTLDPWFVVQTMDWPRNPGIARAQSMDQDNPGIALRKA